MTHQKENNPQKKLIRIEYYTDPLCCWSWAFEPQWRRLRYEFKDVLQWQYRMGGLLPSWRNFSDPVYSVSRPMQMGAVWMEASQISGQPIHNRIWGDDPPASSYPACIAVKCAALQSADAEEAYLRRLREAVMLEGKNIAKEDVIMEEAEKLIARQPDLLNLEQFRQDYKGDSGQQAFREDLQKVRYGNITRFPTLIIRGQDSKAFMITGFRPYEVLLEALRQINPNVKPARQANRTADYTLYWNSATDTEVSEALSLS